MTSFSSKHLFQILVLILTSKFAWAEQSVTFDDYTIHYSAFNSTMLKPEVARQYNITRSRQQLVINISIQKGAAETFSSSTATLSGTASNLLGQKTDIQFREIKEGNAIYYIGNLHFTHNEHYRFVIKVQPSDKNTPYIVNFEQKLYVE